MTKEIWLNLPVIDLVKTKEFYSKIGFTVNESPNIPSNAICVVVSPKNIPVMMFEKSAFEGFSGVPTADTTKFCEVLISIDAESRAEVDELARKVEEAGGYIFGKPSEIQGWMYGFGFADLDGHRWNMLFIDTSKLG